MPEQGDRRGEPLRTFLAEHDEPCPACGYNLRGLKTDTCPECGAVLRVRVGAVSSGSGWFTAGCVGMGIALGVHGVGLLAGLFSGDPVALFVTLAPVVLLIFALGAWVHWRRELARASANTRIVLAALAVSLPITLPVLTVLLAMTLGL